MSEIKIFIIKLTYQNNFLTEFVQKKAINDLIFDKQVMLPKKKITF